MVTILGIESSCDDTSAAVVRDGVLASNVIASQSVHEEYGGVVPELASRAHMQNIMPVVHSALSRAGADMRDISAIAFTRGPGLLGSLLVGTSFAKGLAIALDIPTIDVNHLHAHVLSHFVRRHPDDEVPEFPFMCLLISGGNSQIILVHSPSRMEMLGHTFDDAAGEAFDKCAKVMGLPYPGGPHIDRLAAQGDPDRFKFSKPHIPGLDYSFSGLKTSFLYTLRDNLKDDPEFIEKNRADLAASLQLHHHRHPPAQTLQSRGPTPRKPSGHRRRRLGKLRGACGSGTVLCTSRHTPLDTRAPVHHRQRRHGGRRPAISNISTLTFATSRSRHIPV